MKTKKNLILLGMMGAGKSTIGSLISKKLNTKFIDTDKVIENDIKMTISDIFESKGEIFFRNMEQKVIVKLLNTPNAVIALGGGSFLNEEIRKIIILKHHSFWLNWETTTLLNRIKKNKKRPIASNSSNISLINLIEKRAKIYSKADIKINCEKMTKKQIVKKIIQLYENFKT